MWPIILQYSSTPQQSADEQLSDEEWERIFDEDEIRAIARWVNRHTEKPPTLQEFNNLYGHYRGYTGKNCFEPPGGHAIEGALQPAIVRFPDDPTCEHLIVNHGCPGITVKEASQFHYLEHTDENRYPFHPVRHEHKEG